MTPLKIMIDFSINQKEIIDSFCENKERPKSRCEGKCYLSKMLIENEPSEKKDSLCFESIQFLLGRINVFGFVASDFDEKNIVFSKISESVRNAFLIKIDPPPRFNF